MDNTSRRLISTSTILSVCRNTGTQLTKSSTWVTKTQTNRTTSTSTKTASRNSARYLGIPSKRVWKKYDGVPKSTNKSQEKSVSKPPGSSTCSMMVSASPVSVSKDTMLQRQQHNKKAT